jgi:hypothetical protein
VKKLLIILVKLLLSVAIIGYLVWKSMRGNENAFVALCEEPKHWGILAGAWVCCTGAVLITFVRWWYLVRALDVPLHFRDSIRISFWGYLLNFLPLGIVGGDLIKAVMLAHEHPQHKAKALASVVFDRVVGLYLLFIVASGAMLLTDFWKIDVPKLRLISQLTFGATIVGGVILVMVFGPDMSKGRIIQAIGRIPHIGPPLESLIIAIRMYSNKPMVLLISSVMTIAVHCLLALGCYWIATGLPGGALSMGMYFVVMPLSAAAGVIPLPMGPLEWTLDTLYTLVPAAVTIDAGQGLVVALAYRVITLLTAVLGLPYYFGNRKEMGEVMHEADQE